MRHVQKTPSRLWLAELGLAFIPLYLGVFRLWQDGVVGRFERSMGVLLCSVAFAILVDSLRRAFSGAEWVVEWDDDTLRILRDGKVLLRAPWGGLRAELRGTESIMVSSDEAARSVVVPCGVFPLELADKLEGLPKVAREVVTPIDRRS